MADIFRQRQADANTVIRLTAAVVISDGSGAVLLERRRDCGLWGIPGGRVEPGESIRATAQREVLEETGLRVVIGELIGIYSEPEGRILTFPERVVQTVDVILAGEIEAGEPTMSEESLAIGFFTEDRLPPPEDMVPSLPKVLKDYFSGARGVIA